MKIKCNVANQLLVNDEWIRIESQCQKQTHLGPNESLLNLIKKDEQTVKQLGITFEQLDDFFDKIHHHYNKGLEDGQLIAPTEEHLSLYQTIKVPLCLSGQYWTPIFNNTILVQCVVCVGAETCPFQSPNDKKYHGYEYGDRDWIFLNPTNHQIIHIGDLLFHQIIKHHFFQSPQSPYRVDPEYLIKFFNLQPYVNYHTETISRVVWRATDIKSGFLLETMVESKSLTHKIEYGTEITVYYDSRHVHIYFRDVNQLDQVLTDFSLHDDYHVLDLKYKCGQITYKKVTELTLTSEELHKPWILTPNQKN